MPQTDRYQKNPTMPKPDDSILPPSVRRPLLARLPGVLLLGCALAVQPAQSAAPAAPAGASPAGAAPAGATAPGEAQAPDAQPPFEPTARYTLEELGAQYPVNLRGVDASNTLRFGVRADQVVTGARLDLRYAYSPALLEDLSHINVLVNDEVAASIPVPRETGGVNLRRTVDLPPYLVTATNDLRLQLIGHYTLECEDPLHSSLWANISKDSMLELATTPLALPNDLAQLPLPFYDPRDMRRLELPFVFAGTPDDAMLEAAGALASWFGALAGKRGAQFPALLNELPQQGSAVVLAAGAAQAAGLPGDAVAGPTLSVVENPNDPTGKLLLVRGRDGKELKQAAAALATGSQTLSGQSAVVTQLADLKPRQPYDAPRWLRSDRPVTFGELIEEKKLNVAGYSPDIIRIDVRVPPDLFGWREKKVPIDLRYRYTPQPTSVNSSLLFGVDDIFVKSLPLFALERIEDGEILRPRLLADESLPMRAQLDVPLEMLKSRGQLQFRYMYDYIKQGECRDIIIDNVRGAIEPESTIDISSYPHFMLMPDLKAFAEAGFPFTRLADLSETAVVLGRNAGAPEYGAYLTVMGRMGESTGYPAVGVTVTRAQQLSGLAGKDLLVIASGADQPLLAEWAARMPAGYSKAAARYNVSDLVHRVLGWTNPDPRESREVRRTELSYSSEGVTALVTGFESPLADARSVVLIASNQPGGLQDATAALLGGKGYDKPIQGSLAVVRGQEVDSLVGEQQYAVGRLGLLKQLDWWVSGWLPGHTLFSLLVVVALALLVLAVAAAILRALLVRRRRPAA